MAKFRSVAAALVAAGVASAVGGVALRAAAGPQDPEAKAKAKAEARKEDDDLARLKERHADSVMAIIGNMRPLLEDEKGVRFQSREAVLYKDGTVKLWSFEAKDPVGPPLRHTGPIREVAFLDAAKLLITTSDDAVKVWDGLSGELRKAIEGQVIRPLFFLQNPSAERFVTIDPAGREVTTWDTATLKSLGTFRPENAPRLLGAGLSADGRTLATIGEDRTVTLWDADAKRPYATVRAPSPLVARSFVDDFKTSDRPTVQLDQRFWEIVQPLAPTDARPKD